MNPERLKLPGKLQVVLGVAWLHQASIQIDFETGLYCRNTSLLTFHKGTATRKDPTVASKCCRSRECEETSKRSKTEFPKRNNDVSMRNHSLRMELSEGPCESLINSPNMMEVILKVESEPLEEFSPNHSAVVGVTLPSNGD